MKNLEAFSLEFSCKTTPKLLFMLISTPEGLSRWFADAVFAEAGVFQFKWEGSEQLARLVEKKDNEFVQFQWLDDSHKDHMLEMRILNEPVSSEVALIITDHAEPADLEFYRRLWTTQVKRLQRLFNP
ncbi:MAG: START-like domain-containing protein [Bacteroidales bacterium]